MRMATTLRRAVRLDTYEERLAAEARERADAVREARVEVARRQHRWTELEQTALLHRRPHFLVHAPDDAIFTIRRGVVFEPGSATVGYVPEGAELHYFVDHRSGEIVFLERRPGTWSAIVERKARRAARAAR
jgi:hypothetical protein